MRDERGYRWGSIFFALVVASSLACLPYAISCCSHFSTEHLARRASFGSRWAPGITPLTVALLDWPMGFRLLILTIVAASLCFVATVAGFVILRRRQTEELNGGSARIWLSVSDALLGSLMVGVLYIFGLFCVGYIGYLGPLNVLWFVGVPLTVALIQHGCTLRAVLWTFPLLLGGLVCTGVLSITVGIPLD